RFDLGHLAFLVFGIAAIQLLAADKAKHGVAQELQPFVGCQAGVGAGSVSQSGAQQFGILEMIADRLLAFLQDVGLSAAQILRHDLVNLCGGLDRYRLTSRAALVNAVSSRTKKLLAAERRRR